MAAKKVAVPAARRFRLHKLLDEVLAGPPFEEDRGGWPKFEPGDLNRLHTFIRAVIDARFPRDCDGDTPLEFAIIDRTRYEPSHYFLVPYDHKPDADLTHILEMKLANLQTASGALDNTLRKDRYNKLIAEQFERNRKAADEAARQG